MPNNGYKTQGRQGFQRVSCSVSSSVSGDRKSLRNALRFIPKTVSGNLKKEMSSVLYIEKNQKVKLPDKFVGTNNICAIIYDQLTEIYNFDLYNELRETTIDTSKGNDFDNEKTHIIDWLQSNEKNEELELVLTKHILLSVVSDFVNFIFESLKCAQKGKITVAFAMLRKPLTDELLILEQLFVDRKDFIKRFFYNGDPKTYDPSEYSVNKKDIIDKACEKLTSNYFFPPDLIYDLRYNKSYEAGLNGSTNRALHIVTRDKNYKTSSQNLNFVFSDQEDHLKYLDNFYFIVPHLLFYSVSIIDDIIFDLCKDENAKQHKIIKSLKRIIGFILFIESSELYTEEKTNEILNLLGESLKLKCSDCNHINIIKKADFVMFFQTDNFLCEKCFSSLMNKKNIEKLSRLLEK